MWHILQVAFPNLESLKLSSLSLKKIWDKNDQISASFLRNLTSLIMEDCNHLKYLFSPSIVGGLSKLKQLKISRCDMMEAVLKATEERTNNTETEVYIILHLVLFMRKCFFNNNFIISFFIQVIRCIKIVYLGSIPKVTEYQNL